MRITVHVNGMTFKSKESDEEPAVVKSQLFDQLDKMNKLEFEADDGSYVLIGHEAFKKCILVVGG